MRKVLLPLTAAVLLLAGCKKDRVQVNTNANANPVIAVPIGEVNLTLEHIIDPNDPNDSLISQNNGLYQVVLAQDNVVDYSLTDLVSIPAQTLVNQSFAMGTVPVDNFNVNQSVSLDNLINDLGGTLQSDLTVSLDDINATQAISMESIINDAGGSLQSDLTINDITTTQSISLEDLAADGGGALASSLSVADFTTTQSISLESLSNSIGGAFQSALSISDINENQDITLGQISSDIGGAFQTTIAAGHGSSAPFPSFAESNVGTYSGGSLGNFTDATFSNGTLTLAITNNWPVAMDMDIDLVNTANSAVIFSYSFTNIPPGGTVSDTKSLVGVTLPSTMGFSIVNISSPGSGFTPVPIDTADAISMNITSANMVTSSYNAPFPSVNESNVGTYGAGGSLGNFDDATFATGTLGMSFTNNWPVPLSMDIDIVDTTNNATILSYTFSNVPGNGGTASQNQSLVGVTLPSTMGMRIVSVNTAGSGASSVPIDLADAITLSISGTNMEASSLNAPFPAVNQTNVGTYSSGSLGNFTDVTFSNGSLTLALTNNWPIALSMDVNLVNTTTNATIVSYSLSNVSANGGTASQTQSMVGVTLPSTLGFEIASVTSPGSPSTPVSIDMQDEIDLGISSNGLEASQFTATFPVVNESNVGTYAADSLGNFTSASFSSGDLSIGLTNDWPVDLSMTIDLVNSITDSTLLTYTFTGVAGSGGTATQTNSLAGVTLPSTLGFKIISVSSPGSPSVPIGIDLADEITLDISGANLQAASFVAPFPAINATDAGTYNAPQLSMFSSASFSSGSLAMSLSNDWPVDLSMTIELINTATSATILSYAFTNVAANGGNDIQTNSLVGVTLPNTLGVKIASVVSPGSPNTAVTIDLMDEISFDLQGTGLEVYNAVVDLDTMAIANQSQVVDLGLAGVEISSIAFNTCDLNYNFNSTIPADVEVQLTFPSSDKNGVPLDTTITIAASQTTAGTISLNSTLFDLSQDTVQNHSRMPIALNATLLGTAGQVQVDSSQGLSISFDMDNVSFDYIEGYFGDTALSFPVSSMTLGIDFLDQFNGEITFEDPSLDLSVTSNIGMPMELALDFSAFRGGQAYPLNGPPQMLPYPTTIGDSATGSIFFDITNSAITDVFTLPFDSLSYGGQITINPDTVLYGKYNFVTADAKVSGDLLLDLPFTFSSAGMTLSQPLDSNLNIENQLPEFVDLDYAKLIIFATSTLPLDATVDLKFYDDLGNLVLVKPLPLLESGIPNSDGVVVTPNTLSSELTITAAEFQDLMQARVVVAEATVVSYNNGGVPVKLRTDATVGLAIGLEAKVNVEL